MVDYLTDDAELTSVADAIRETCGISGQLTYPFGFASALNAAEPWPYGDAAGDVQGSIVSRTTINSTAFRGNKSVTFVSFPNVSIVSQTAFSGCTNLMGAEFRILPLINSSTFSGCVALSRATFPECSNIYADAFNGCTALISLYLMHSTVATLSNSNAFNSTPIGGYSAEAGRYGSIFVPANLLDEYQAETNWALFRERFVGVEMGG